MITARASDGEVVATVAGIGDAIAYIDADWLPAGGPRPVPAIIAGADGLRWLGADGEEIALAAGDAATAIAAAAADAARSVPDGARVVEVVGGGAMALLVTDLLGPRVAGEGSDAAPDAVVDLTGDPDRVADATRRLADLGTLVLAGEPCGRTYRLDLYPDVHSRGLVVRGVHPARAGATADATALGRPASVAADAAGEVRLPPGPTWYAVTPAAG